MEYTWHCMEFSADFIELLRKYRRLPPQLSVHSFMDKLNDLDKKTKKIEFMTKEKKELEQKYHRQVEELKSERMKFEKFTEGLHELVKKDPLLQGFLSGFL